MSEPDDADWLTLLREARENLAMSMTRLAERSGLSYPTVLGTLTGKSVPRLAMLQAMVDALLPPGSPEAKEIMQRYTAVTGRSAGPAAANVGVSPYYQRLLVDVVRAGLADIAAAIREGHPGGHDHH